MRDKIKHNKEAHRAKGRAINEKSRLKYTKMVEEAVAIKQKMIREEKEPKELTKKLTTLLKALKHSGDAAIPTKKDKVLELYEQWNERTYVEPVQPPLVIETEAGVIVEVEDEEITNSNGDGMDGHEFAEAQI